MDHGPSPPGNGTATTSTPCAKEQFHTCTVSDMVRSLYCISDTVSHFHQQQQRHISFVERLTETIPPSSPRTLPKPAGAARNTLLLLQA